MEWHNPTAAAGVERVWSMRTTYHSTQFTKHSKNILKTKIVKRKLHLTHFKLVITEGPIEQERPATQKATDLSTAYSQHIKQNRG